MRFRERDGVGIEFGFSWTYLADVSLLGNPRSFVSRVTLDRARAIPREMSSTAPLAIVRGTARELFLRHPRGGRLYVAASRLHRSPRRRAPRPTARPRTSPGPKARTNTTRASSSTRRVRASRAHRPPISHRERPERRTRLAPPRPRPPRLTPSHLFLTLHHQCRLPRHRSGLPQGETRPKRGRGGQVHARHVRGPAVPRRLTPAPQGGRARLRLPPAPRLPSPRRRPLRAVSLFVCTYGQLESRRVLFHRECIETFVSDPPPPSDTPEYLARLVPVERTCDASVDVPSRRRCDNS